MFTEDNEAGETGLSNVAAKMKVMNNKKEFVKKCHIRVLTPEELREQVSEKIKNSMLQSDRFSTRSQKLNKNKGGENNKTKTGTSKSNVKSFVKILPQPSQQNISVAKSTFPFVIPSSSQPIFVSAEMIQVPSQFIPQTVMSQNILSTSHQVSEKQIQMPAHYISQTVVSQQADQIQISPQFIPQTVISQQTLKQNNVDQGHTQFIQQNVKNQQKSDINQQLQNVQNVANHNTSIMVSSKSAQVNASVVQKRFRNILPKP